MSSIEVLSPNIASNVKNMYQSTAAVFKFARSGNTDEVAYHVELGTDINAKDEKGRSLLMEAVTYGHLDLSEWLIACGAHVNAVDNLGNSVLMTAAFKGHVSLLKLLLNSGANSEYRNPKGQSAEDFARIFDRIEILVALNEQPQDKEARTVFSDFKDWLKQVFLRKQSYF
jgi:ankyrin repeat protein